MPWARDAARAAAADVAAVVADHRPQGPDADRAQRPQPRLPATSSGTPTSLDAVAHEIATHGAKRSVLAPGQPRDAGAVAPRALRRGQAGEAGSASDFVARTIKKVLDEETTRMENGLAVLATVGATSTLRRPVRRHGLGRVPRALVAIGMSGAGTLDRVAGPVGEALIMTDLGLAVAIPAVVAYSWSLMRAPDRGAALSRAWAPFCLQRCTHSSAMGQPLAYTTGVAAVALLAPRAARPGAEPAAWPPVSLIHAQAARRSPRSAWSPLIDVMLVLLVDLHRHSRAGCSPTPPRPLPAQ